MEMLHSVKFDGRANIMYDFVNIDVSFTSFEYDPLFLVEDVSMSLMMCDAEAHISEFKSRIFDSFFWTSFVLSSDEWDDTNHPGSIKYRYLKDSWGHGLRWSQAYVTPQTAVNGGDSVAKDYVRYIAKVLLGSSRLMGLYSNTMTMMSTVIGLDDVMNDNLVGQLDEVSISRLLRSNLEKVSEREYLEYTRQLVADYMLLYESCVFFYFQPSTGFYFFPLKLEKDEIGGWVHWMEIDGLKFWSDRVDLSGSLVLTTLNGMVDYTHAYQEVWLPVRFMVGDVVKIWIGYTNELVTRRSYCMNVHMKDVQCFALYDGDETNDVLLYDECCMNGVVYKFKDIVSFYYESDNEGTLCINGRTFMVDVVPGTIMNITSMFTMSLMEQPVRRIRNRSNGTFKRCYIMLSDGRYAVSKQCFETDT